MNTSFNESGVNACDMNTSDQEAMLREINEDINKPPLEKLNETLERSIQDVVRSEEKDTESEMMDTSQLKEANDDDNPKLMAISSVVEMFKKIKSDVESVKRSQKQEISNQVQRVKNEILKDIANAEEVQNSKKKVEKLEAEVAHWKHKSEVLTEVVDQMNVEMQDLSQKVENLELNSNKRSVIVTGIEMETDKNQNWQILEYLFKDKMNLEVIIEDFYLLGNNPVVTFQSMNDKRTVMKYKSVLKKIRNGKGGDIYINEFLPQATQEKRRRERDLVRKMDEIGKAEAVTYTNAGLTIAGIPHDKKVKPPTPKQLINLDIDDLERILKMKISKKAIITQDRSVFIAYIAKATTHSQIRDMYCKLKMCQPGARHIVCAYNISHPHVQYAQDYHDDGEPGVE